MVEKTRVLICDGGTEEGTTGATVLRSLGFDAICTKRGNGEILGAIRSYRPEIAVIDAQADGIGATEIMRAIEREMPGTVHFVVTSEFTNIPIDRAAVDSGRAVYLIRPYTVENLLTAVYGFVAKVPEDSAEERRNIEVAVTDVIHRLGIPAHVKGYHYLREAIMLSIKDRELMESVTKVLYPAVADKFSTTPSRVERAIRHAIEIACDRCDVDVMVEFFGHTVNSRKGKPTNSEFIAMIADYLRLHYSYTVKA